MDTRTDLLMSILEDLAVSILELADRTQPGHLEPEPEPGLWSDEYVQWKMEQEPPSRYIN